MSHLQPFHGDEPLVIPLGFPEFPRRRTSRQPSTDEPMRTTFGERREQSTKGYNALRIRLITRRDYTR